MKDRLTRFFPSDVSRSFDNAKRLSDYIGTLARMVFIGPLALLALYWAIRTGPAFSLAYISLMAVTAYFLGLTIAIFLSFSWLTAGYLHLIFFGGSRPSRTGVAVTAGASVLLLGALAVTLYEIIENSSIVREALSAIDTMTPQ